MSLTRQPHAGDTEPNTCSASPPRPQPLAHVGNPSLSELGFRTGKHIRVRGFAIGRPPKPSQHLIGHWFSFLTPHWLRRARLTPAASQEPSVYLREAEGGGPASQSRAEVACCHGSGLGSKLQARAGFSGLGFPASAESARPSRALCALRFRGSSPLLTMSHTGAERGHGVRSGGRGRPLGKEKPVGGSEVRGEHSRSTAKENCPS